MLWKMVLCMGAVELSHSDHIHTPTWHPHDPGALRREGDLHCVEGLGWLGSLVIERIAGDTAVPSLEHRWPIADSS